MSLDYYIISQTTGDRDSVSQVLTQNYPARENRMALSIPFDFDYPVYNVEGATFNYYEKDFNSISYDITNGKIYSLIFTANTQSLSGQNSLTHSLYRINYTDYELFLNDPLGSGADIQEMMSTPLVSIVEYFSGITLNGGLYTYSFPTQFKDPGQFTQDIFNDKDQFFLDNPIGFDIPNDLTLGDAYSAIPELQNGSVVFPRVFLEPSATTRAYSNLGTKTITGDTAASGYTFQGAFFTYFVPPKKPNLNVSLGRQRISVEGAQTSLSPIFNFNNTDDGDYYQLQVNYDTNDTPYSGTNIYTYYINKQAGDAEFVRTFSTPLRANDTFIYRIGNTKEIENIFGNKQSITTWSDSIGASISSTGRYTLSGITWRNMISETYFDYFRLSGVTVGAETPVNRIINVTTTTLGSLPLNSASAVTNGVDTIQVFVNGNVSTLDWQNAINIASAFTSMNMYVIGGDANSGSIDITGFNFTLNTQTHRFPSVVVKLTSVFLNTSLDLGIDMKNSNNVVDLSTINYVNQSAGQQFTRISDANGNFDFGNVIGGYYLLEVFAQPPPSVNSAYEPVSTYITISSNLSLDLVLSIVWGNQLANGFDVLSNVTFL